MSIQKFSLDALNKVRQYIRGNLTVTEVNQQSQAWATSQEDDIPEPESLDDLSGVFAFGGWSAAEVAPSNASQWFISTVNPAVALLKLPGLSLKPEYRLVSYLFRAGDDGVGLIFAVPESLSTTAQLEKPLAKAGSLTQPPRPDGALPHVMEAIEGDRSPVSFIVASLLRRELQEFGAVQRRQNWSRHQLIDRIPSQLKWQWQGDPPKDLSPKVKQLPDGQAAVEFFTCRKANPIVLYRHLDQYPATQYKPVSLDKALAVGQP